MRKFFISAVAVSLGVIGYLCYELQAPKSEPLNPVALANIDALTEAEGEAGGLDTSYNRHEGYCEFYVKANATITILGLGIFTADGNGLVKISGQLACSSGGNFTCRPIECYDIYQMIADSEKI